MIWCGECDEEPKPLVPWGTIKAQRRGDELMGQDPEAVRELFLNEVIDPS